MDKGGVESVFLILMATFGEYVKYPSIRSFISLTIIIMYVSAYVLAVLIAVITPVRRVITNDQGLTGGPSYIFTFLTLS